MSAVDPPAEPFALRLFDVALVLSFLGLTFLLGVFPLKDTDFWWHLRAGDMIRQSGVVPKGDPFTYSVPGKPWVDLHWIYQVGISWLYGLGGVPALTLAKCAITTFAVFLLVTARRREWPIWAMLVAWLPALLVLGGRMYVRPETLTLLYLSIFLAVLSRIDRFPALAFLLPIVQVAWVNTQGLFVFGPALLTFALFDAALRPGSFATGRARWWKVVGAATVLTGLACFLNPYGLSGALYPLQLLGTMGNPVFSRWIAELMPVPIFIQEHGIHSLPLQLQFVTMVLGALSFLAPMCWVVMTRLRPAPSADKGNAGLPAKTEKARSDKAAARSPKKGSRTAQPVHDPAGWRLNTFRLLLAVAFCVLSMQATRNSHQFAAVLGTVTAWNIGEWVGAIRRRARQFGEAGAESTAQGVAPRLVTFAAIAGVFVWVASGAFYETAAEGRTIGLDEQPLWYPHEAVKFSGGAGMPPRLLTFHIGHASLYDYYFGPEKKVYVDARLEVIGADLFERYTALQKSIVKNTPDWSRELDAIDRPVILADHETSSAISGSLLASNDWRCVWFDAVAGVFVHVSNDEVLRRHEVDFAARHFRPEPAFQPRGTAALVASAKGLRNVAAILMTNGSDKARGLRVLGLQHAHTAVENDPGNGEAWKMLGQLELMRERPTREPIPRFRLMFDPVFDLSSVRSTYALKRAADAVPNDFTTLLCLEGLFKDRAMIEAELPVLDRLAGLTTVNPSQVEARESVKARRAAMRASLGPPPPDSWDNLNELRKIVGDLLSRGRAATAADYLERASAPESRPWDETDRIATLRLHLGEPAAARAIWQKAPAPPKPAVRQARVAATLLVEGSFDRAREEYHGAIKADPELFEAHYGLAVLEQDAGRADDALKAARRAVATAPTEFARSEAQSVVATVTPYASSVIAEEKPPR